MRHRRRGRKLGRNPKHQRALLKNLATSLILTERDSEDESDAPKTKGRVVTTVQKAKEVRPLVEKCVTIARRSLPAEEEAEEYATGADRNSEQWHLWRNGEQWQKWNQAIAPAVAARRRVLRMLGSRQAVQVLFKEIAPRFIDRDGGYTRIMRLAQPRLGDGGAQAILEFVGVRDRVIQRSEKPTFEDDQSQESPPAETESATEDGAENIVEDSDELASAEDDQPSPDEKDAEQK